ncbi:hypothetical protein BDV06DRAFT_222082 [Aspergillus oleicola]
MEDTLLLGGRYSMTMTNTPSHKLGLCFNGVVDTLQPLAQCLTTEEANNFSRQQYQSPIADSVIMNADSDTTAAGLTSKFWFLLTNTALARLHKELTPPAPDPILFDSVSGSSIFKYDTVKDLPFLRACIDEPLRLHPPIAY